MRLITRQSLANVAAERWRRQYGVTPAGGPMCHGRVPAEIVRQLEALGPTPKPDDVDRVIGNTCWTRVPNCDECDTRPAAVVEVGEEPNHESNTASLCLSCLQRAVALFPVEVS